MGSICQIILGQLTSLDEIFWQKREDRLSSWKIWQHRSKKFKTLARPKSFAIQEFGVNYQISLGAHGDIGIYSDMAWPRKLIFKRPFQRVLNLFCYTGAFSLLALKKGADSVISVDSSNQSLRRLKTT